MFIQTALIVSDGLDIFLGSRVMVIKAIQLNKYELGVELPVFLFRYHILLSDNKHRMIQNIAYILINSSK